MSAVLTDEERAIFERRLGAAHVEMLPCFDDVPEPDRPFWLFARCTVGDWSKALQVTHEHRLDQPGEARTGALKMLAFGFLDSAPHLFPVAASS